MNSPLTDWRRLRGAALKRKSRLGLGTYVRKYFRPSSGVAGEAVGHEEVERLEVKIEI